MARLNHSDDTRRDTVLPKVTFTPLDKLAGNEDAVFAELDRKLEAARKQRQLRRAGSKCCLMLEGVVQCDLPWKRIGQRKSAGTARRVV